MTPHFQPYEVGAFLCLQKSGEVLVLGKETPWCFSVALSRWLSEHFPARAAETVLVSLWWGKQHCFSLKSGANVALTARPVIHGMDRLACDFCKESMLVKAQHRAESTRHYEKKRSDYRELGAYKVVAASLLIQNRCLEKKNKDIHELSNGWDSAPGFRQQNCPPESPWERGLFNNILRYSWKESWNH